MKIKHLLSFMICCTVLMQAGISHAQSIYPNPDWREKSYAEVFEDKAFSEVVKYIESGRD